MSQLWDEYDPAAALFNLGAHLADRKTKVTEASAGLARRYLQLIADAQGQFAVETAREVGRKFELLLDEGDLQAKEAAQRDGFLKLSNAIDRALRSAKPSNDLKFRLAQALSDAGHVKEASQRISQAISSAHGACGDRPVQAIDEIVTLAQVCCRNGKFNQNHCFVLDAATTATTSPAHAAVVACANALSSFYSNNFEAAATGFARVRFADARSDEIRKIITREEIAALGALSAIAQLPRPQLHSKFVTGFAAFLDLTPSLRDAVVAFSRGDYRSTFEGVKQLGELAKQSPHLSRKMAALSGMIRDRIFLDFFESYTAISLADMANKLGGTVDTVLATASALVKAKKMPARVDAVNMVLERFTPDEQAELLERTLADGLKYHETVQHLLLQTSLQAHKQRVTHAGARSGGGEGGSSGSGSSSSSSSGGDGRSATTP